MPALMLPSTMRGPPGCCALPKPMHLRFLKRIGFLCLLNCKIAFKLTSSRSHLLDVPNSAGARGSNDPPPSGGENLPPPREVKPKKEKKVKNPEEEALHLLRKGTPRIIEADGMDSMLRRNGMYLGLSSLSPNTLIISTLNHENSKAYESSDRQGFGVDTTEV